MAKSTKAAKTVQPKEDNASGKEKALGLAMEQITKQFGDGAIMKLGDSHKSDVDLFSSGALSIDLALGGGFPRGRIIEVYGPETLKDRNGLAPNSSGGAYTYQPANCVETKCKSFVLTAQLEREAPYVRESLSKN